MTATGTAPPEVPGPDPVAGAGPGTSTEEDLVDELAVDEAWRESERQRLVPPGEPPMATCDWGDCEEMAVAWRSDPEHGYLPVCEGHREREVAHEPGTPGDTPPNSQEAIRWASYSQDLVLVEKHELEAIRWASYDAAMADAEAHRDRALQAAREALDRATRAAYERYGQAIDAADQTLAAARRAAMHARELALAGQAAQ